MHFPSHGHRHGPVYARKRAPRLRVWIDAIAPKQSLRADYGFGVLTYAFRADAWHKQKYGIPPQTELKHRIGWRLSFIQPIAPISSNRSMARRMDV